MEKYGAFKKKLYICLDKTIYTMELCISSITSLREVFQKIVELYSGEEDQLVSTDFFFQPDSGTGYLLVFNDDDAEIAKVIIPEWSDCASENFYDDVAACLKEVIEEFNVEGDLERLAVWMPYSFVLVDDERESICDLLLVDDDTLLVSDSLLKGLNEELNAFLERLLED